MKSRDTKRRSDAVAEKATGRVAPFPYHRAIKAVKRENKNKAAMNPKITDSTSIAE